MLLPLSVTWLAMHQTQMSMLIGGEGTWFQPHLIVCLHEGTGLTARVSSTSSTPSPDSRRVPQLSFFRSSLQQLWRITHLYIKPGFTTR